MGVFHLSSMHFPSTPSLARSHRHTHSCVAYHVSIIIIRLRYKTHHLPASVEKNGLKHPCEGRVSIYRKYGFLNYQGSGFNCKKLETACVKTSAVVNR